MKPYIICHMMSSVDGRIDCDMTEKIGGDEYYEVLKRLDCSSELSGRVTMQKHFAMPELFMLADAEPVGRESFYEAESSRGYSIAVDSKGRLRWPDNRYDEKPLLVFTSEQAPKEYFEALHRQNISWIAAGKEHVDLSRAVEILNEQFGVDRLAVVGGGPCLAAPFGPLNADSAKGRQVLFYLRIDHAWFVIWMFHDDHLNN